MTKERLAPRDCPVCGERLALTRLTCHGCGTELSGDFASCEFCALGGEDRETLRVFLQSRGNVRNWSGTWVSATRPPAPDSTPS